MPARQSASRADGFLGLDEARVRSVKRVKTCLSVKMSMKSPLSASKNECSRHSSMKC